MKLLPISLAVVHLVNYLNTTLITAIYIAARTNSSWPGQKHCHKTKTKEHS